MLNAVKTANCKFSCFNALLADAFTRRFKIMFYRLLLALYTHYPFYNQHEHL
eukprot:UN14746